jgi:hypothetical protein
MFPSDHEVVAAERSMPSERLEAELTTLAAQLHAGMGRFLLLVAEFDRRGLYESWECRSTSQWLSWKCAIGPRAAREQVHVARALERLPLATAAFARGQLSYAKVRAMARVVGVVPEDELMNLATEMTAAQLERTLGRFKRQHNYNENEGGDHRTDERWGASWWWDDEGMFHLEACVPPEDGAIIAGALAGVLKRAERDRRRESGSAEPLPADEFDPEGLVRRSAEAVVDLARAATGPTELQAPAVSVVVHADLDRLLGQSEGSARAWIDGGPAISGHVLRRLGCDAGWRLVVEDRDANPLYVGRQTREPTTAQRVAIWSRSGGRCEAPHCSRPLRQIHHVHWWSTGGPTDIDNLVGLCAFDHHAVHNEKLEITALGGQRFVYAIPGRASITPTCNAPPPDDTIEQANAAAGVICGPTTCASHSENEPFDVCYVVDTLFDGLTTRRMHAEFPLDL